VGKRIMGGSSRYLGSVADAAGKRRKTTGWEYVHVAVDDATPLAMPRFRPTRPPDETAKPAIAFLGRAVRFFRRYGLRVERLLTENGSA
jgi:hypothetical protein